MHPLGAWQVSSKTCIAPVGIAEVPDQPVAARPSTWQVAQLVWPSPLVTKVLNRNRRPAFTVVGVAPCSATRRTSARPVVLTQHAHGTLAKRLRL
jgi:hypothetical protein